MPFIWQVYIRNGFEQIAGVRIVEDKITSGCILKNFNSNLRNNNRGVQIPGTRIFHKPF